METPRTGSTAIASELCSKYDGKSILHKHANYDDFRRIVGDDLYNFFVFAGVRNPLDDAVSVYWKLKSNHKSKYTDPKHWLENGGSVTKRERRVFRFVQTSGSSFYDFLKFYYRMPYVSRINLNAPYCHYIIRYESLQADFDAVLSQLDLNKIRDIPVRNPTKHKPAWQQYYTDKCVQAYSAKVFAPFMREWDYRFPSKSFRKYISPVYFPLYELAKTTRGIYSRMVSHGLLVMIDRAPL